MRTSRHIFFSLLLTLVLSSSALAQSVAQWYTSMGDFRAIIREDLVPITGNNFIDLANDYFYDDLIFHRVIDGFVIQDGDPTGTGYGGPGWTIPLEIHPDLRHDSAGVLAMARSADPNSAGSQYYFTLAPQPQLDDNYAVFGKAIEGLDVILAIGAVPTDANDRPITPVVIDSLRILGVLYPYLELNQVTVSDAPINSDQDGVLNPNETGQLVIELKNMPTWLDADNTTATLSCDDARVNLITDTVEFGTIADGDSLANVDTPFEFSIDSDTVFSTELNVHISANPNAEEPYDVDFTIPLDVTLNQAGWPYYIGGGSTSSALLLDLNLDGTTEVIFGDSNGLLHAFQPDGQSELSGFPVDLGSNIYAAVAAGNLDDDAALELAVGTFNNRLVVVDDDGSLLVDYPALGQMLACPIIADVDQNGSNEIIGVTVAGFLVVLNADGSTYGSFPMPLGGAVQAAGAVSDLNNDGFLDLVVMTNVGGGTLRAISLQSATDLAGWPYAAGSSSINGPVIADVDQDDQDEVLIGLENGNVVVLNHDGSLRYARDVGAAVKTSMAVTNLNPADGDDLETIFVASDGQVYVVDADGNDLFDFPQAVDSSVQSSPIVADLNANGLYDIIFGDEDGNLHAIDPAAGELDGFPVQIGGNLRMSPAAWDVDQDGDLEIAMAGNENYFVIDYKQAGTILWPCFKANPQRTGNVADIAVAVEDDPAQPTAFRTFLGEAYPNPFNPSTQIEFGLAQREHVSLRVYDVSGRLIATLVDDERPAGPYRVTWQGRDADGQTVNSGIYLFRLKTAGFEATRRVVLVK